MAKFQKFGPNTIRVYTNSHVRAKFGEKSVNEEKKMMHHIPLRNTSALRYGQPLIGAISLELITVNPS